MNIGIDVRRGYSKQLRRGYRTIVTGGAGNFRRESG